VSVHYEGGLWVIKRGDFRAEWDPQRSRGWVRQCATPYAIDGVLRILHSLLLVRAGGFLVHAASAVRGGRAFVFAGVSGAGKTTLARLAPADVMLLTDEISYLRPCPHCTEKTQKSKARSLKSELKVNANFQMADSRSGRSTAESPKPAPQTPAFEAFGTPFAGELARLGRKVRAPLAGLFLLQQGSENRVEVLRDSDAIRELLRHILFFAHDGELVPMVFQTVCDFVKRVPVRRLVFTPEARVWELIV
jgi:hypothetical protein